MERIVDTHCHLDFNSFDNDRELVLERARESGVIRILNPGIDLVSSQLTVKIANQNTEVYSAIGVHPNSALSWNEDSIYELEQLSKLRKVVAIGEIGLDYYRDRAPRTLQRKIFEEQLSLAASVKLPVVIHNREASDDILDILEKWHDEIKRNGSHLYETPGVLHSFSEDMRIIRWATDHNFFLGITGPITFKNAGDLRKSVTEISIKNLLIETDAPFLTPHPFRGKRNEPAHVKYVAKKIAEIYNLPYKSLAKITTENAARLFKW